MARNEDGNRNAVPKTMPTARMATVMTTKATTATRITTISPLLPPPMRTTKIAGRESTAATPTTTSLKFAAR